MSKTGNEQKALYYGNWVSGKLIAVNMIIALVMMIMSVSFFFIVIVLGIVFLILFILFFLFSLYLMYARYLFSTAGRGIQNKIYDLILNYIDFNGKGIVLDIGCGNAPVTIELAKKYPKLKITGIDNWSGL